MISSSTSTGLAVIVVLATTLNGCAESSFELAEDSRLPIWFSLSDGDRRSDYRFTMDYYISSSGRTAVLKQINSWGLTVKKIKANLDGLGPQKFPGTTDERPVYEVLRAEGKIDVVEHKKPAPIFHVTSDEAVWEAFVWKKALPNDA